MIQTEHMIVRGIPTKLKRKIAKRVEKRGTNLNEVVVEVLAREFDVAYEPRGRRSPAAVGDYENVVLDVPAELKQRIQAESSETKESIRNIVVRILAAEFKEPFVPTGRWINREAATA